MHFRLYLGREVWLWGILSRYISVGTNIHVNKAINWCRTPDDASCKRFEWNFQLSIWTRLLLQYCPGDKKCGDSCRSMGSNWASSKRSDLRVELFLIFICSSAMYNILKVEIVNHKAVSKTLQHRIISRSKHLELQSPVPREIGPTLAAHECPNGKGSPGSWFLRACA